ncbi:CotO family spore coat protein [Niallia sp. XMNu-256]|uniref:CotO family spore coat protein n=1 Tax=Niallia sp. XMNu-256 TaxID=3082444 RepID=UPI0030D5C07F
MSTNQSREPLLYIMQPAIKFPKANMQETFTVAKPGKQKPLLNGEAKERFDSTKEEPVLIENNEVNNDEGEIKVETKKQSPEKRASKKFDSKKEDPVLIERNEVNNDEGNIKVETKKQSPEKKVSKKIEAEEVREIIEQYHQVQSVEEDPSPSLPRTKKSYSFKPVKSFKEMAIPDKLNYLSNFPKQLPPVPCIFITQNSSIKGFLLHSAEDFIEVKQFNNKKIELYTSDLINIKMIGLK